MTGDAFRSAPSSAIRRPQDDVSQRSPALPRAVAMGVVAAVVVAAGWALLHGIFDITVGLVAAAAVAGWLIGAAVRQGAWSASPHGADRRVQMTAAALAAAAWLAGSFAAYVLSLLVRIPGSQASLAERMANAPFTQFIVEQQGLLAIVQIVLMIALAWRAAR